ncbi:MAG: HlyC/CorC family transporter [Stomatobaculum sp.]|nr:HlyC/CorC family transporter [Stomatobaculum sp.]
MDTRDIIDLLVLIVLLGLSGFFSSAETALTTANRIRIRTQAERGDKNARILLNILDQPDKMLSVILVGNNIVNLYASSLATTLTIHLVGSKAVGITTGLLTLFILVFGEITPKTRAAHSADTTALRIAPVIRFLMIVLTPLVIIVNALSGVVMKFLHTEAETQKETLTEEELRTIVQVGHEEGVIAKEEQQMIDNVFDFGDTIARDIMIPRIDMTWVPEDADYDTVLSVFREDKFTRMPVCRESADTVVGIINVKDLLLRDPDKPFRIGDFMREPLFTHERKKTSELMREMRKNYTNIAIVLDEYGVTAGMVTLEDLLEEIVGEIRDEYDTDEEKSIRRAGEGEYVVEGDVRIPELNEALDLDLSSEENETVGGLVVELLDHLPEPGESVSMGDVLFTVREMDKNRIGKLSVRIQKD